MNEEMRLEIRRATSIDFEPLAKMLDLYQHDLSDIWDRDLNADGSYGYSIAKYISNDRYWAFVFLVNDKYAGFALVDDSVSLPENELWMSQFFVMKKYRCQGIGGKAAQAIFDTVRGRWEIGQMPENLHAQNFWRRVVREYRGDKFSEYLLNDERWHGPLQCFDNMDNI